MEKSKGRIGLVILAIFIIAFFVVQLQQKIEEKKVVAELQDKGNLYYYKQLNKGYMKYGQIIYNELYANMENLKNGKCKIYFDDKLSSELEKDESEGKKYVKTSARAAILAFTYDNPELYFLDTTKYNVEIIKSDKYRVTLEWGNSEKSCYVDDISKDDIENMNKEINLATSSIMLELNKLEDDYSKIKKVHDYLVDTIEYTDDVEHAHDIYGALVNKKCVCEGYADAFKWFMDKLNIDSIFVSGTCDQYDGAVKNVMGSRHAWNYVRLNQKWYAIDCTWDDPLVEDINSLTKERKYKYFLCGEEKMNIDHHPNFHTRSSGKTEMLDARSIMYFVKQSIEEENFEYPQLNAEDYN